MRIVLNQNTFHFLLKISLNCKFSTFAFECLPLASIQWFLVSVVDTSMEIAFKNDFWNMLVQLDVRNGDSKLAFV